MGQKMKNDTIKDFSESTVLLSLLTTKLGSQLEDRQWASAGNTSASIQNALNNLNRWLEARIASGVGR